MRRLVAGAAGLTVGLVGTLAFAVPAQATGDHQGNHHKLSSVRFVDDCEGTNVKLKSGKFLRKYEWTITVENGEPQEIELRKGEHKWVAIPKDAGEITVDFKFSPPGWPQKHTWYEPKDCEQPPPPVIDADLVAISSCDLLAFIVRNTSEEDDATMTLTPTQDTTHGHAPSLVGLIDEEGETVELPEDTELVDPQEIMAGNAVGPLGPFTPTTVHAHGFEAVEGLEVHVLVEAGGETLFDETVAWDTEGLDCEEEEEEEEENGGGGELPKTGASTTLIVAGAVALLALGGGLFMIARRRRVTFTA
jgi:LPXTG-motif cell wall-anchored protein